MFRGSGHGICNHGNHRNSPPSGGDIRCHHPFKTGKNCLECSGAHGTGMDTPLHLEHPPLLQDPHKHTHHAGGWFWGNNWCGGTGFSQGPGFVLTPRIENSYFLRKNLCN